MRSLFRGATALTTAMALVIGAGLASHRAVANDNDAESITPDVVMQSLFMGKSSPLNTLKAAIKADAPDWAKIKEAAAKFPQYGPELGKNEPPQGDKDSWAKLTQALSEESKALDEAAAKEDFDAVAAKVNTIGASCKSCHSVHRPD